MRVDKITKRHYFTPWYLGKDIFGGRVVGRKYIYEGSKIPKYLGKAYDTYVMDAVVMYPRPLHLLFRFIHWLDYWTILPRHT